MVKKTMTASDRISAAKEGMLKVQEVSQQVQRDIVESEGFTKTIAIASGLVAIEEAMTDEVVAVLEQLQGNPMGFKADKAYSAPVVKQVAIRAMMHNANLHGNEFNIIAGQCYLTKEYFERKLREYPGVTDLVLDVYCPEDGVAKDKQVQLKVGGYASCKLNGKLVEVFARNSEKYGDQRFVVVAFNGDIDQAMGKGKKRLAQKLYERIAGVVITEADEASGVTVIPPKVIKDDSQPKKAPQEQTIEKRIATAVAAYKGCQDLGQVSICDGKIDQLFSEIDEDAKQLITDARNEAIDRLEKAEVA